MTVSAITGTLDDIRDPHGKLYLMMKGGWFRKRYWAGDHWNIKGEVSEIAGFDDSRTFRGEIDQTTGCCKTMVAAIMAYAQNSKGFKSCGNFRMGWTDNNAGKPKKEWRPVLNNLSDLTHAPYRYNVIDDVSSTISDWRTDEATIMREIANATRKRGKRILFTTQRMTYIPPAIRDVLEYIYVPFVYAYDTTHLAPDGRFTPLNLLVLKFSPSHTYMGFDWIPKPPHTLYHPYYLWILNNYDTMEIATGLKEGIGEQPRTYQPGYQLEVKAMEFLKEKAPAMNWQHLNGTHVFDIVSDTHAIDVCGTDPSGALILEHKNLLKHIKVARMKCQKPYLLFKAGGDWRFIPITHNLNNCVSGKRIAVSHISQGRLFLARSLFS